MKKSLLFACAAMACFSMSAEDLVVFSESANAEDTYWDPSWTTNTDPSKFNATTAGKIDIAATAHEGAQSLSISWTSATGGDWGACVAREGWATYDLSKYNELNFWVYSETAIAAENLPAMQMENGGYQKSEKIAMGDFLPSGVPAKTWTLVKIAREDIATEGFGIEDLKKANPEFAAYDNIKGLFFSQNAADGKQHTLYIDEVYFSKNESSSVNDIEYTSENAIYYANGNVYGVAGNVSVFNVAGQLVAEGTAADNTFAVALNNGLYIVVSENGNSKIVVR